MSTAYACLKGIEALKNKKLKVFSLQKVLKKLSNLLGKVT